jgi:hypothetical protein
VEGQADLVRPVDARTPHHARGHAQRLRASLTLELELDVDLALGPDEERHVEVGTHAAARQVRRRAPTLERGRAEDERGRMRESGMLAGNTHARRVGDPGAPPSE